MQDSAVPRTSPELLRTTSFEQLLSSKVAGPSAFGRLSGPCSSTEAEATPPLSKRQPTRQAPSTRENFIERGFSGRIPPPVRPWKSLSPLLPSAHGHP